MVETLTKRELASGGEARPDGELPPARPMHEAPIEDGLVAGRPVEDRSFEVAEAGVGAALGMVVGTAVAPGVGTAIGAVVGAAAGFVAGEALERHEGKVARTIDAVDDEPVPHG